MFNFKKKTKNQVETIEKKETTSVNSIFPKAKDLLERLQQNCKNITPEEILEKINSEALSGNRYAMFYDCYISDELVEELRIQGYKVEVSKDFSVIGPHFKVIW